MVLLVQSISDFYVEYLAGITFFSLIIYFFALFFYAIFGMNMAKAKNLQKIFLLLLYLYSTLMSIKS